MKQEKIFKLLYNIAIAVEPVNIYRVTAAIVYKNNIISIGIAHKKTHPLQVKYNKNEKACFLHAEIDSIRKIKNVDLLKKSTLYVCRIKKHKIKSSLIIGYGNAKPCIGCQRAIIAFGIKKTYYSTDSINLEFESLA